MTDELEDGDEWDDPEIRALPASIETLVTIATAAGFATVAVGLLWFAPFYALYGVEWIGWSTLGEAPPLALGLVAVLVPVNLYASFRTTGWSEAINEWVLDVLEARWSG